MDLPLRMMNWSSGSVIISRPPFTSHEKLSPGGAPRIGVRDSGSLASWGFPCCAFIRASWFGESKFVFGFGDISPPFSLLMMKTFSRGALRIGVFGIRAFLDIFSPLRKARDDSHVPYFGLLVR